MCLVFLNAVITGAPTFNQKVYHQQELENAGFDPDRLEQVLILKKDGVEDFLISTIQCNKRKYQHC